MNPEAQTPNPQSDTWMKRFANWEISAVVNAGDRRRSLTLPSSECDTDSVPRKSDIGWRRMDGWRGEG
eukprot:2900003-Rhodomonas_salina.1